MLLPSRRLEPKVRATLYISPGLLDEARNAAVHLAGFPARLTLTKLVEAAVRNTILQLRGIDTYSEFIERHQKAMSKPPE